MFEEGGGALKFRGKRDRFVRIVDQIGEFEIQLPCRGKGFEDFHDIIRGRGLVECNAQEIGRRAVAGQNSCCFRRLGGLRGVGAQVDAPLPGGGKDIPRIRGCGFHDEGVEKSGVRGFVSQAAKTRGQAGGEPVDPARNGAQTIGPVVDGIHARHDGEQNLGGADITRRLVAPDVLLPGLDGQAIGRSSRPVPGDTDDAPGKFARVFFAGGQVGGVGSTEAQGNAETLAGPDGDVGAEGAG